MANINNMHSKKDYIMAYEQERFEEYVAQREADLLLMRRIWGVLLVSALICAGAAFALSF